ncbi:uncharacterized protein LOC135493587 [Lineus longissimus]|uniref:uncharacterized protein LOC135493587 n=1 Tax=Lineus longissimus TaxID=88925 RepID=UPI00315C59B1
MCTLEPDPDELRLLQHHRQQALTIRKERDAERIRTPKALAAAKLKKLTPDYAVQRKKYQQSTRKRQLAPKYKMAWTPPEEKTTATSFIDSIPNMTEQCANCKALMFPWESSKIIILDNRPMKVFSKCCDYGTIKLKPFANPTPALQTLFNSPNFLQNIRQYNNLVSMSSKNFTGKVEDYHGRGRGPQTFKISGQMYHLTPNLFPLSGQTPKFSQIFVYDQEHETNTRMNISKGAGSIDKTILTVIQSELSSVNPYVHIYKNAAKVFQENPHKDLRMVFKAKGSIGATRKHHNPDVPDIVFLAPGEHTEPRDVVIYRDSSCHPKQNDTIHINEQHPMYDPTSYPLIMPHGESGFSFECNLTKSNGKKLTALQFFRFHLQVRDGSFNTLHKAKRLAQEYLCDQWQKIEKERLQYIKYNQDSLRVEQYRGLADALSQARNNTEQTELQRLGQLTVLPSSFTGSPRYMYKHYLDALAIARKFRKFDLFITFTANPRWTAVTNNLFPGHQPSDRPDIVNRIFQHSLNELIADFKHGVLGTVKARLHVIEGQFRGMKHAHILLLLQETITVDDIDNIIQAQIPDPHNEPKLYEIVTNFMLHGPCGPAFPNAPCMIDGKCRFGYPKNFNDETTLPADGHGYPIYKRPDNGQTIQKNNFTYDNRWVVPHNKYLLLKMVAHINVEYVGSFHTIKYIYKYVHKGSDVATVGIQGQQVQDKDEIAQFINARSIDAYDAHWRTMEYSIQDRYPAVQSLAIHLQHQQNVIFKEDMAEEALDTMKDTTLMAFFKLNQNDPDAREYLYADIPEHYTWQPNHTWKKRATPLASGEVPRSIGRINNVSPIQGERFYLKLLLGHIKGPTSYDDLRNYQQHEYNTFKETALAMGLLEDDSEWTVALMEVSQYGTGKQIRATFAVILQYCSPTVPKTLYDKFFTDMSEDIVYQEMQLRNCTRDKVNAQTIHDRLLTSLNEELSLMGGSLANIDGMPQPNPLTEEEKVAMLLKDEIYDKYEQASIFHKDYPSINEKQAELFNLIQLAVHSQPEDNITKQFVLNSPGGYGKTFTMKLIAAKIRAEGLIVLNVASTGLAAQNLIGGRTAHSRFKIPIPIMEDSTCNIKAQSALASLIKNTSLIIWDEIFSVHRYNIECVERTLRDIMQCQDPWGGIVVLLGGDPRQTPPVVKKAGRPQIVRACIQFSPLYHIMTKHKLTVNMRTDAQEVDFSEYLLRLGDGQEELHESIGDNMIQIPEKHLLDTTQELIDAIFPDLDHGCGNAQNLTAGTIYTPLNKNVHHLNDQCLAKFPGVTTTYLSADSIHEDQHKEAIPTEYLNSLTPSGLPDHELKLKVGCPVMLLRNLQGGPSCSLRNGTRMTVIKMMQRTIECQVSTGINNGLRVFLPRIPHHDRSGDDFPFTIVRRQFPIRLSWAVTINKGQGQKNDRVGIYLPNPVFAHGQLYTAFSRGKIAADVKVLIEADDAPYTKNIVYHELL